MNPIKGVIINPVTGINKGVIDPNYGRQLALRAYELTARYDKAISSYIAETL